jgi:hypothetical protein
MALGPAALPCGYGLLLLSACMQASAAHLQHIQAVPLAMCQSGLPGRLTWLITDIVGRGCGMGLASLLNMEGVGAPPCTAHPRARLGGRWPGGGAAGCCSRQAQVCHWGVPCGWGAWVSQGERQGVLAVCWSGWRRGGARCLCMGRRIGCPDMIRRRTAAGEEAPDSVQTEGQFLPLCGCFCVHIRSRSVWLVSASVCLVGTPIRRPESKPVHDRCGPRHK